MYDEEIEKAVLYYIIFAKEDLEIEEEDFISNRNIQIAKAIMELKKEKKEISILSVQNKIKANHKQVLEYISSLGNNIYGSNCENTYNKLKDMTKRRKLLDIAKEIIESINQKEDIEQYMQDCIKKINDISKVEEKNETFIEQIVKTAEEIEKNYNHKNDYSLYTGIYDLDDLTCGLHNKELTIIGARPRSRKNNFNFANCEKYCRKK